MISRKELAHLRRLLASGAADDLLLAASLIASLADPELDALLTDGISFDEEDRLICAPGSEIVKRARADRRVDTALACLLGAGGLPGVTAFRADRLCSLDVLAALPDLERLHLYALELAGWPRQPSAWSRAHPGVRSLELGTSSAASEGALAAFPGLRALQIGHGPLELSALAPLTGLETLKLAGVRVSPSKSLSSLPPLPSLRELTIDMADRLVSLDGIAAAPALETLWLGCLWNLEDASAISALASLTTLALNEAWDLPIDLDLSANTALSSLQLCENRWSACPDLSALTALRSLDFAYSPQLQDLSALAPLSWLESLELARTRISDLSPLAGLSSLGRLSIDDCEIADLSPLASLGALRSLEMRRAQRSVDLSPLASLGALRSLDLTDAWVILDLSPLTALTELESLILSDRPARGLEALAGKPALAAGAALDDDARPILDGEPLVGFALLRALYTDAEALAGAREVDLRGCQALRDLTPLADLRELRVVRLTGAGNLRDATALVALPALERLETGECAKLRPRPKALLTDRAGIVEHQRKLARALKRKKRPNARERRWLADAESRGLLTRRPRAAPPAVDVRALRALMRSPDRALARQGLAILESLEDPALLARFLEGIVVSDAGAISVDPAFTRRPHLRRDRRAWTLLSLLRIAGRLDGIGRLELIGKMTADDLSPLAGVAGLTELVIADGRGVVDLSPLALVPDLASLSIVYARGLRDLSPLSAAPSLRRLKLRECDALRDLSPLSEVAGLEVLELEICESLADLSPLSGLSGLAELSLARCEAIADLSPLVGLSGLARLNLNSCWGLPNHRWVKHHRGAEATQRLLAEVAGG